jgi:hypothetical protein
MLEELETAASKWGGWLVVAGAVPEELIAVGIVSFNIFATCWVGPPRSDALVWAFARRSSVAKDTLYLVFGMNSRHYR